MHNRTPIVGERGVNRDPPQDQYFKGALMLATLRSVLDDDARWFALIKAFYQHFKYQNILTEDVIAWWNRNTHLDLTAFFNQYLRRAAIPALELSFDTEAHTVLYKWQAEETAFAMPIKVGEPSHWQTIHPTTTWQTLSNSLEPDDFHVATDLFYVNVSKTVAAAAGK